MHIPKRTLAAEMVIAVATIGPAWGQTVIYVSKAGQDTNDGLTWETAKLKVQTGLDVAQAGDQVWVAAGTYVECITLKVGVGLYGGFAGNETDLSQRSWTINETILDGNQQGSVVKAVQGAEATTRIDGFTIRNGWGTLTGDSRYGGGIFCDRSSPTIANNTVTGNTASSRRGDGGGGIYCYNSSPTIANNTITGNRVSTGGGGAIYCGNSSPMIANNVITGNDAGSGGGIYCEYHSSAVIANNTIAGNGASTGGGISCYVSSSAIIANNAISGNEAPTGGGIYCHGSSPTIANNTMTGNIAGFRGGGICCDSGSSPMIANAIIAFNSSGVSRGGLYPGNPTLTHNCVYGNTEYNYSGIPDPTGTDGNISADPLFVDAPNGDLHLQDASPCIDAGMNGALPPDITTDLDGKPRFLDDPSTADTGVGTPPIVDMGAYEFRRVFLDIRPGACPNPLNPRSRGVLPVAVLGADSFDVSTIDLSSLLLKRPGFADGVAPVRTSVADASGVSLGGLCTCGDAQPDGRSDLVLKFRTRDVIDILGLNSLGRGESVTLTLTGRVVSSGQTESFAAVDCVQRVPLGDFDADGDVDGFDFLTFANCYNGADNPPLAACGNSAADLEGDDDVDGFDFLTFANCYNGSDRPPNCP